MVLSEIHRRIMGTICGSKWEQAEKEYEAESFNEEAIERLALHVSVKGSCKQIDTVQSVLKRHVSTLHESPQMRVKWLEDQLIRNSLSGIVESMEHCVEFTLRCATDPIHVREWAGSSLKLLCRFVLDNPFVVRLSRFYVLAMNRQYKSAGITGVPECPGWNWQ